MTPKEIVEKMEFHLLQLQYLQQKLPKDKKAVLASYTRTGNPIIVIDGGLANLSPETKVGL